MNCEFGKTMASVKESILPVLYQDSIIESNCKLIDREGLRLVYNIDNLEIFLTDSNFWLILSQPYPLTYSSLLSSVSHNLRFSEKQASEIIAQAFSRKLIRVKEKFPGNTGEYKTKAEKPTRFNLTNLELAISQDCNLRCSYCSAGYGRFGKTSAQMDATTVNRAISMLFPGPEDKHDRMVIFTGGETLLNQEVLWHVLRIASQMAHDHSKAVHFFMNTNGIGLTEKVVQKLVEYGVDVTVSIDGVREIHDKHRCFPNGSGSFDLAVQGLLRYMRAVRQKEPDYPVTVQVCLPSGEGLWRSYIYLKELGVTRLVINPAWPSPFISHGLEFPLNKTEQYLSEYERILQDYLQQTFSVRGLTCCMSATQQTLSQLLERETRPLGCGAAHGGIAISVHGEFYPCTMFFGYKDFCLGNLNDGISEKRREEVQQRVLRFAYKCRSCWAWQLCGAGCLPMALAQGLTENHYWPSAYCDLFRGYIERDIVLFAKARLKQIMNSTGGVEAEASCNRCII